MKFNFLKRALLLTALAFPVLLHTQTANAQKANWQNLDLKTDSVFGISTEKAYTDLLKGKKHVPVLVAVIDAGVDITHEDLKTVIWNNPKEIAGNGVDDDHNGYVDDIHGWDFIGGPKGDVNQDNLEITRLVRQGNAKYGKMDSTKISPDDTAAFHKYEAMKADLAKRLKTSQYKLSRVYLFKTTADSITTAINNPNPTAETLKNIHPPVQAKSAYREFW